MDGTPNFLVPLAFLAWFPITGALFLCLPPRRAVLISLLAGWLFLPVMEYEIKLIPEFNKTAVINLSLIFAIVTFDTRGLMQFRPRWFDFPIVLFCMAPLLSSMSNGLGVYDGISESFRQLIHWGIPYCIGRIYFSDLRSIRDVAVGVFIAGLVYVPFCLFEIRMSPQLNMIVYGYHQHSFLQHMRFGGWRPMVFMDHGLMLSTFMASATLCGVWLWRSKSLPVLFRIPLYVFVLALAMTTLMTKSVGAIILLLVGLLVFFTACGARSRLPYLSAAVIPIAYVLIRTTAGWSADTLVDTARWAVGEERAQSLAFRLHNEDALTERALERPGLGWAGWGRARIRDQYGRDLTITDSLWIIILGNNGIFGLTCLLLTMVIPLVLLPQRIPLHLWTHPRAGAPAVLAILLIIWLNDSLLNAMLSPFYPLLIGTLAGTPTVASVACHTGEYRDVRSVRCV